MYKICLTGGPGAGKSESVPYLKKYFEPKGYQILFVPETAARLLGEGLIPNETIDNVDFQAKILDEQIKAEDEAIASVGEDMKDKTIVIFDRGLLDGNAYIYDLTFDELLKERELDHSKVFGRYDQVYFLESSAIGAPEHYTWKGDDSENDYRMENPQRAREVNYIAQRCWMGHPDYRKILCQKDFSQKMENLVKEIDRYVKAH